MESKEVKTIHSVHERDLEEALDKIGSKEAFEQGALFCKFCKSVITKENIYSILPESGSYNFVCDEPKCVVELMGYLEEKGKKKIEK